MRAPLFRQPVPPTIVRAAAATLLLGALVLARAGRVLAHSDPPDCSATGVALFFSVFEEDGVTPAVSAEPGGKLIYQATLGHAGGPQCNYEWGILQITTPDGAVTDVTPPEGIPLVRFGIPFVSVQVPYDVQCGDVDEDGNLQASAAYTGGLSHFGPGEVSPLEAMAPITTPIEAVCVPSSLLTQVHDPLHTDLTGGSVPQGTAVHDQATLSDGENFEAGVISFVLFDSGTCDGEVVASEDVPFVGGSLAITVESAEILLGAGSYSYLASYDGDTDHFGTTAACEPFAVEGMLGEGCTLGYWKQEQHFDSWSAPYTPGTEFSDVFARSITVGAGDTDTITDPNLLEALAATGGGISALARDAVAALLNAASPDVEFAFTPQQVIQMVQEAIDSADPEMIEATKDRLAAENEQGCPLN